MLYDLKKSAVLQVILLFAPISFAGIVATPQQVKDFLGGGNGRIVYTKMADGEWKNTAKEIWYMELNGETLIEKRVVSESVQARNPLISDDGQWITYNTGSEESSDFHTLKCYVCPLRENGGDSKIEIGDGGQPHFWKHPITGDEFIIYNDADLEDGWQCSWQQVQPCSGHPKGATYIRRINPATKVPLEGPKVLLDHYANGGRSKAGGYLFSSGRATGVYRIDPNSTENAQVYEANEFFDEAGCNPSTSPHANDNDVMFMQNGANDHSNLGYEEHTYFLIRKADGSIVKAINFADAVGDENFYTDTPEWSTAENYATFVGCPTNLQPPYGYDIYLYRVSDDQILKLTDGNDYWPHLWVDPSSVDTRCCVPSRLLPVKRPKVLVGAGRIRVTATNLSMVELFNARGARVKQTVASKGVAVFENVRAGTWLVKAMTGAGSTVLSVSVQ